MPQRMFNVGDRMILEDLTMIPEGSWVIHETMQFLRTDEEKLITSITPIKGEAFPSGKSPDRFTVVYAGDPGIDKSSAVNAVFNTL